MKNIAVFGSGTMGNGIAHVFALNGFQVQLFDKEETILARAIQTISSNLDRQIKKNIITVEQKESTLQNIKTETLISSISKSTDLVIEAIVENKLAKISLYNELLPLLNPNFILATNTSSISITELAPKSHSDKFIGMHFMNPVPMMELVEIIKGHLTSEETLSTIVSLSVALKKKPVAVNDYPGFIANRILMPMINEAIFALYENVATAQDIDQVMKLGMNHPMGPLALADYIGLDVCLSIMEVLYSGFSDSKYRPCPLLKKMVASGNLGKKSGIGFYTYNT
ncbi:MAG: 3-hydroxybutyryl-CoA dehydrogenase [Stygiobacter sp. RIFOXYC12_FULL_38_8]|nr:MAG: 3-hydroxybutyryl-CoA dehydrogenase [Stygiobacter sp. GWC2_38_9]OGU78615.1 MAG: 3-hydroxybutyryl-CoA dehydrogenase [Stygiobacter sp. RIFOXYA12_FULL_38_9]OGV05995.1 MAG: 3-hydroxybutyryl-CoA dehydrogenase [Stygiobacter sp. RIFOXYB2_FULL_37_11]OGV11193.1 MAG: 3-hydroxybutyryl-CoA dehydrogenase [Stygiobacter sp. RIFOXYA2_FULL_38_8]OGV16942.1 MAG: 3-hydroxybutyryl-CoA dehydrogenase [Stygiobacter sp. RIFOXYC2_FULL_38_25]OGV28275.1 MAG: 3-hydroxybutyryl-CoA dehydrogenase [Stygiobacter sp. RIF